MKLSLILGGLLVVSVAGSAWYIDYQADQISTLKGNQLVLETEIEKKYRLWQTVKIVLWEIPEAVEIGFTDYAKEAFTERHEALQYHDKNCTDFYNCNICDIMKRWFE